MPHRRSRLARVGSSLDDVAAFAGNPIVGAGLNLVGGLIGGDSEDTRRTRFNQREADRLAGRVESGIDPSQLVRSASLIRRGARPGINAAATSGTGRFGSGSGFARGAANRAFNQALIPQLAGLERGRVFRNFDALQRLFESRNRAGQQPLPA